MVTYENEKKQQYESQRIYQPPTQEHYQKPSVDKFASLLSPTGIEMILDGVEKRIPKGENLAEKFIQHGAQ